MTWILGFVFVTLISASSMIGFLLIPAAAVVAASPLTSPPPAPPVHPRRSPVPGDVAASGDQEKQAKALDDQRQEDPDRKGPSPLDSEAAAARLLADSFARSLLHNGLEGLALGSLLASALFHLIPHAFDLVGQGTCFPPSFFSWRRVVLLSSADPVA